MIHTQDDETEGRSYRKRVASLDDYNFISAVVKKPGIAKPLAPGTIAIRHNAVSLLRQIKSDVSELGEGPLESRTPHQLSQPRTRNAIREIVTDENRAKEHA